MFSSLILDVGIGLVFVYFILSLLCSVIVESVASLRKWRAKTLLKGVNELIFAPQEPLSPQATEDEQLKVKAVTAANDNFLQAFKRSPLFLGQTPSYISSRSFVLALLETVKNHPKEGTTPAQVPLNSVENIKQLVTALPQECYIKKALLPILELAGIDLDKAMEGMEKWYDESMDRVTGWYKRHSQVIALVVAFLVAFALNADTFQIATTLYSDQTVRAAVVNSAQDLVKHSPPKAASSPQSGKASKPGPPAATTPPAGNVGPTAFPGAITPQSGATGITTVPGATTLPIRVGATPPPPGTIAPLPGKVGPITSPGATTHEPPSPPDLQAQVKQIEQAFKLGIPLGWTWETFWSGEGLGSPIKWLGILFTAFMAVMGSNFWFDLLNQLINVRSSGKKPLSTETEAKK
jgi:hypothetical protein